MDERSGDAFVAVDEQDALTGCGQARDPRERSPFVDDEVTERQPPSIVQVVEIGFDRDHRLVPRQRSRAGTGVCTDAEVLQEILRLYTAIKRPQDIDPAFDALLAMVESSFRSSKATSNVPDDFQAGIEELLRVFDGGSAKER